MVLKTNMALISIALLISSILFIGYLPNSDTEGLIGNIMVSDDPTGTSAQSKPGIAVDNNDKIHTAWLDGRDGTLDLFYSNSTDSGVSFSSSQRIDDAYPGDFELRTGPNIAIDDDLTVYIIYYHFENDIFNISIANSTDGGVTFNINNNISDAPSSYQYSGDVATNGSSTVYAVWSDSRSGGLDIYFAASIDNGNIFGTNKKVNDGTSTAWYPAIGVDSKGTIHIVWEDQRSGDLDVYYASSIDSGATFSTNKKIGGGSSTDQSEPSLYIDTNDYIYVSYTSDITTGSDIYHTGSTDGGTTWSTSVKVNEDLTDRFLNNSAVGVADSGQVFVSFQDNRSYDSDTYYDIYVSNSTDSGISFGNDTKLNNDTGQNKHEPPQIAADSADSIYIVWSDDRESFYDIYLVSLQATAAVNRPPNVVSVTVEPPIAERNGTVNVTVVANDLDDDILTYFYNVTGGTIIGTGSVVQWKAPAIPGVYDITAWVRDGIINSSKKMANLTVYLENRAPIVTNISADKLVVEPEGEANITVLASDPDGDVLTYYYHVTVGDISGSGSTVKYLAPALNGTYLITAWVSDGLLNSKNVTINITVQAYVIENYPPVLTSISAKPSFIKPQEISNISVVAYDADEDELSYHYEVSGGTITGTGANVTWTAPSTTSIYTVSAWVYDGNYNSSKKGVNITVSKEDNNEPKVEDIKVNVTEVNVNGTVKITVTASDLDADILTYTYEVTGGTITGEGANVTWTAPDKPGTYTIKVKVNDGKTDSDFKNIEIKVLPKGVPVVDKYPDLVVQDSDVSFSESTPMEGTKITISAIISNQGDEKAINVTVSFHYGDTFIGSITTPLIIANDDKTVTMDWVAVLGNHTIKIVVDENDLITESDETNNIGRKDIEIKKKDDTNGNGNGDGDGDKKDDKKGAGTNWLLYIVPIIIIIIIILSVVLLRKRKPEEPPGEPPEDAEERVEEAPTEDAMAEPVEEEEQVVEPESEPAAVSEEPEVEPISTPTPTPTPAPAPTAPEPSTGEAVQPAQPEEPTPEPVPTTQPEPAEAEPETGATPAESTTKTQEP